MVDCDDELVLVPLKDRPDESVLVPLRDKPNESVLVSVGAEIVEDAEFTSVAVGRAVDVVRLPLALIETATETVGEVMEDDSPVPIAVCRRCSRRCASSTAFRGLLYVDGKC